MKVKKITDFLFRYRYPAAVLFIFLIGAGFRLYQFGSMPAGFNQDEAYAAYEAYSLLNFGVDSFGYHNPVYFIAWGSGMNALETYLAIPLFRLFGESITVFRIPQLIVSLGVLISVYFLIKEMSGKRAALLGLLIFAVSPWQIMLSRWGLESNLAPGFLIFGLFFFVKGIKNSKYFMLSAMFYGLSLYAYSTMWITVPLTLFLMTVYLLIAKVSVKWKYVFASAAILFVLALPLMLFLLVNFGYISEIKTNFISIPKLVSMRNNELSLSRVKDIESFKAVWKILIGQDDGMTWNTISDFGLCYYFSIPFIFIGLGRLLVNTIVCIGRKKFSPELLILPAFIAALFSCLLVTSLNINRANGAIPYLLMLIALGLDTLLLPFFKGSFVSVRRIVNIAVITVYLVALTSFGEYYFGDYKDKIAGAFMYGMEDSVNFVKEEEFENVYVDLSICFAEVLWFDKTPHDVFADTVVYNNWPSPFMNIHTFSNYTFEISYHTIADCWNNSAYIFKSTNKSTAYQLENLGLELKEFGYYTVAYMKD